MKTQHTGETIGTSQKPIPVTSQQSAYKIANIVGSEEQMALLEAEGFDPTKRNPKTYAAYYAGRLDYNPFTGKERDYESHAITGSMSFAYLFSGATVRAEEMGQFRRTMYPMPGDSRRLVEAKRKKGRG